MKGKANYDIATDCNDEIDLWMVTMTTMMVIKSKMMMLINITPYGFESNDDDDADKMKDDDFN